MSDILHSGLRSHSAPMLFSAVPAEQRAAIEQTAPARRYNDGEIIQQRGEKAAGFYLIETGSVAVGRFLANGDFRGVALLSEGDSWGELAMFAARPRVVDAVSRGTSLVRFISEGAFNRLLQSEPQIMRQLLSVLSSQLQEMIDVMASIRRGSARPRIAAMLLALIPDRRASVQIEITQQELGELLGLTRATVNAALSELESSGIIRRGYGTIEILAMDKLDDLVIEA